MSQIAYHSSCCVAAYNPQKSKCEWKHQQQQKNTHAACAHMLALRTQINLLQEGHALLMLRSIRSWLLMLTFDPRQTDELLEDKATSKRHPGQQLHYIQHTAATTLA
jgi:hypothetical protein